MAGVARPLRDFARPVVEAATSCIVLEAVVRNYELKDTQFNQLSSFYGVPAEDALNFIREFYIVLHSFPLNGLTEDQLKLKCFPYTLKDRAKTWLMSLTPNSLETWGAVYEKFMARYYSNQKTQDLRTQIVTFSQSQGETFHESWDRFRSLQRQCPHHHFPPELLNQFFYDGLAQNFQYMVDNVVGGDISAKTAQEISDAIDTLASNSQQKSARGKRATIGKVTPSYDLTKQLAELTKQVQLLSTSQSQPHHVMTIEPCGICGEKGHGPNVCPRTDDPIFEGRAQVYSLNGYQQPCTTGWSNNNSSWRLAQPQGQNPSHLVPPLVPSLEDTLKTFIQASHQIFENVEGSIERIEAQVGLLAGTIGDLVQQRQPIKLQSRREQVHAVTVLMCEEEENVRLSKSKAERKEVHPYFSHIPFPSRLLGDPGSFNLKISYRNDIEVCGMLDLGAGANVMPYSLFRTLELGELKPTNVFLQLADDSLRYPKGIIEDVSVKVGGLKVLADFIVLDVSEKRGSEKEHALLLVRPFMATTNALIDVKRGVVKMSVMGRNVSFSVPDVNVPPSTFLARSLSIIGISDALAEKVTLQVKSVDHILASLCDAKDELIRVLKKESRNIWDDKTLSSPPQPPHLPDPW